MRERVITLILGGRFRGQRSSPQTKQKAKFQECGFESCIVLQYEEEAVTTVKHFPEHNWAKHPAPPWLQQGPQTGPVHKRPSAQKFTRLLQTTICVLYNCWSTETVKMNVPVFFLNGLSLSLHLRPHNWPLHLRHSHCPELFFFDRALWGLIEPLNSRHSVRTAVWQQHNTLSTMVVALTGTSPIERKEENGAVFQVFLHCNLFFLHLQLPKECFLKNQAHKQAQR